MNIPYEKDNKERIPFTHYLEEFQALDPETASLRSVCGDSGGSAGEDHGDPHDRQRHSCRTDG